MKNLIPLVALPLIAVASSATAQSYSYAVLDNGVQSQPGIVGGDRPGALYEAGSIGKFACTIAALRLSDQGKLNIDATLQELLPDTADTPIAEVTLRQVLQSRSGIADGLLPAFSADPRDVMGTATAREAVLKFATGALANEPGSVWSYDLVNWIVVQAVIEQATGRSIASVLEDEVLRPANMDQSRIFVGSIGDDAQEPAEEGRPIPGFLACAGGLATTVNDLLSLARFPHQGGLSEASLSSLTEVATPEEGYALGGRFIMHSGANDRLISWQTGSNGAYKSLVTYDPVSDMGFAAMTAGGDASDIQAHRDHWMATLSE